LRRGLKRLGTGKKRPVRGQRGWGKKHKRKKKKSPLLAGKHRGSCRKDFRVLHKVMKNGAKKGGRGGVGSWWTRETRWEKDGEGKKRRAPRHPRRRPGVALVGETDGHSLKLQTRQKSPIHVEDTRPQRGGGDFLTIRRVPWDKRVHGPVVGRGQETRPSEGTVRTNPGKKQGAVGKKSFSTRPRA